MRVRRLVVERFLALAERQRRDVICYPTVQLGHTSNGRCLATQDGRLICPGDSVAAIADQATIVFGLVVEVRPAKDRVSRATVLVKATVLLNGDRREAGAGIIVASTPYVRHTEAPDHTYV